MVYFNNNEYFLVAFSLFQIHIKMVLKLKLLEVCKAELSKPGEKQKRNLILETSPKAWYDSGAFSRFSWQTEIKILRYSLLLYRDIFLRYQQINFQNMLTTPTCLETISLEAKLTSCTGNNRMKITRSTVKQTMLIASHLVTWLLMVEPISISMNIYTCFYASNGKGL